MLDIKNFLYKSFVRKRINYFKKKKFYRFGRNSIIEKPYLQLSGLKGISLGENVTILKHCRLANYGKINEVSITIGDRCYIGFGFSILGVSRGKIVISNDVLIASNVLITNENHGINPELEDTYMNQELEYSNVFIGEGCWIGEKVIILPGVRIGKKSIIGAGSVVTKSIPDYSIAVGNPAKVIKSYNFKNHSWEKI